MSFTTTVTSLLTRVVFLCLVILLTHVMSTTSSDSRRDGSESSTFLQKRSGGKEKVSFRTEWKGDDESRPRFGFGNLFNSTNLLPNVNPGSTSTGGGSVPSGGGLESLFGGSNNFGVPGTVGTIGASAVLVSQPKSLFKSFKRRVYAIKGGFLTLLTAVKSIVVPALVTLLLIAFLIAGAAYFTCSIVDCQGSLGDLTRGGIGADTGFGGGASQLVDRNTFDFYDRLRPIYQAIDEGHQKYGTSSQGQGNSALLARDQ